MTWFGIMQILSTVIECLWLGRKTDREKDLEILLLRRPHQALAQQTPIPRTISTADGPVRCHPILGGIQNGYYRDAA
jgi:hypothetical protein